MPPHRFHGRHPPLVASLLFLQWSTSRCATLGDRQGVRGAAQRSGSQVYYVTDVADKFSDFSKSRQEAVGRFHLSEQDRLQTAIRNAVNQQDKSLLETTAMKNEEARLETQNAFDAMLNLMTTLKQAMGAQTNAESCDLLTCGEHAFCNPAEDQARCRCQDGYEGNGFVCKPPTHPVEHSLFQLQDNAPVPRIADVHIGTLRGNRLALVYRDVTQLHKGYVMLGKADPSGMNWGAPLLFSNQSQAFGPVLVELQDGRGQDASGIAIAFRDANRGGSGILLGGKYNADQNLLEFGPPQAFARYQAQGMGLVALPQSHVAVVFAEHAVNGATGSPEAGAMYGSALLAKAEDTAGGERAEAACTLARAEGGELFFAAAPLVLEPARAQIWARSVALLAGGVVAYTYHSGSEQLTKQALLRADPETHQLSVLRGPAVVGEGFTPYVGSVSTSTPLPQHQDAEQTQRLQAQGPRLLTLFAGRGSTAPRARFCKADAAGLPDACQDLNWTSHELTSVAGAPVGDGRLLFVFTDARQTAYYKFLGAMDPL